MWFRPGFLFGGLMLPFWVTVAIVIAALTTWWVLLALLPLLMGNAMAMTGMMARSADTDPRAALWGWWCTPWFAPTRGGGGVK